MEKQMSFHEILSKISASSEENTNHYRPLYEPPAPKGMEYILAEVDKIFFNPSLNTSYKTPTKEESLNKPDFEFIEIVEIPVEPMVLVSDLDKNQKQAYDLLNSYKVFSLKSEFSERQLKKLFKKLAKILHPDHNSRKDAGREFNRVLKSYRLLTKLF